jgi:hypothetical protein
MLVALAVQPDNSRLALPGISRNRRESIEAPFTRCRVDAAAGFAVSQLWNQTSGTVNVSQG